MSPSTLNIIQTVVITLGFLGPIILWFGYVRYKIEIMGKTSEQLQTELKESTQELRTVIVTVKAFASTQEIVNKFTADTLNSIMHRLDMIESRLNNISYGKPYKD